MGTNGSRECAQDDRLDAVAKLSAAILARWTRECFAPRAKLRRAPAPEMAVRSRTIPRIFGFDSPARVCFLSGPSAAGLKFLRSRPRVRDSNSKPKSGHGKSMIPAWFWFRSSLDGPAAKLKRTSDLRHQAPRDIEWTDFSGGAAN